MELKNGKFARRVALASALLTLLASNVAYAESENIQYCDSFIEATVLISTTDRSEEHVLSGQIEVPHDEAGASCVALSTSECFGPAILVNNGCDVPVRWGCDEASLLEIPAGDEIAVELDGAGEDGGFSRSCSLEVLNTEIQVAIDGKVFEVATEVVDSERSYPSDSSESKDDDGCSVTSLNTPSTTSLPLGLLLLGGCLIARRRRAHPSKSPRT